MELDELATKIMNHIDETTAKAKSDIIREVNVLMENQQKQFTVFGEGLQGLSDHTDQMEAKINGLVEDMDIIKPLITDIDKRLTKTETNLKQVK